MFFSPELYVDVSGTLVEDLLPIFVLILAQDPKRGILAQDDEQGLPWSSGPKGQPGVQGLPGLLEDTEDGGCKESQEFKGDRGSNGGIGDDESPGLSAVPGEIGTRGFPVPKCTTGW